MRKLDRAGEARLVALTCSPAPEGRTRWTLRLLAKAFVAQGHAASLSHETVRQVLKKRAAILAEDAVVHPVEGRGRD